MLENVPLQSGGGGIELIIIIALALIPLAGFYKMLKKAGEPGWGIIPIINIYFLVKMSGKPMWWIILLFIPIVNFIAAILIHIEISKNFGGGILLGLGLTFFAFICYPLVGFGNYQWQGQGGQGGAGGRGGAPAR